MSQPDAQMQKPGMWYPSDFYPINVFTTEGHEEMERFTLLPGAELVTIPAFPPLPEFSRIPLLPVSTPSEGGVTRRH